MKTRIAVFKVTTNQQFQRVHFHLLLPNDCDHVFAIQAEVNQKMPVHNFAYQRWGWLRLSNWEELIFETTLRDETERAVFDRTSDMELSSVASISGGKSEPSYVELSRNATQIDGMLTSETDQLFTVHIYLYYIALV